MVPNQAQELFSTDCKKVCVGSAFPCIGDEDAKLLQLRLMSHRSVHSG